MYICWQQLKYASRPQKKKHRELKYKCDLCDFKCPAECRLRQHLKSKHGGHQSKRKKLKDDVHWDMDMEELIFWSCNHQHYVSLHLLHLINISTIYILYLFINFRVCFFMGEPVDKCFCMESCWRFLDPVNSQISFTDIRKAHILFFDPKRFWPLTHIYVLNLFSKFLIRLPVILGPSGNVFFPP